MAPSSFRVDTLAVRLIERLEARRRTWRAEPMVASGKLELIAQDQVHELLSELAELGAGERYRLEARRALLEDLLPRYIRLALEQNELEERGWRAWRGGDPLARILGGLGTLALALVLSRFVRNPVVIVAFVAAILVPFGPELRSIWYRWQYRRALQGVVDDLARQQEALDALPEVDLERELRGGPPVARTGEEDPEEAPAPEPLRTPPTQPEGEPR